jgi:hypothetical protein
LLLSGWLWLRAAYFALAYIALLSAAIVTNRRWKDWLNPLTIVLFLGFVRYGLSGVLGFLGVEPDIPLLHSMGVQEDDWLLAHVLALIGLVGAVIGWFIPARFPGVMIRGTVKSISTHLSKGIGCSAALGMILGSMAVLIFVESNASLMEVVWTGGFRGTEIREGTGKYFYLGLMLIASSVVCSAYLAKARLVWWKALLPVFVAMLIYWPLGGRARALTPFAAGLLLVWYGRAETRPSIGKAIGLGMVGILFGLLTFVGQLYRGGFGVEAVTQALSVRAILDYSGYALWNDLGQLYALAGAIKIGPASLGGRTFVAVLWPFSELLNIPGRSAGIFIVESLVGFPGRRWGVHASLIGDAYLNFGPMGVVVLTSVYGSILRGCTRSLEGDR